MRTINARVRRFLSVPDAPTSAEQLCSARLAVYAVATGQKLGLEGEDLIRLRLLAELGEQVVSDSDLESLKATDSLSRSIVSLCRSFAKEAESDYKRAESWLKADAPAKYPPDQIDALQAVRGVIQPIGT